MSTSFRPQPVDVVVDEVVVDAVAVASDDSGSDDSGSDDSGSDDSGEVDSGAMFSGAAVSGGDVFQAARTPPATVFAVCSVVVTDQPRCDVQVAAAVVRPPRWT